MPANSSHNNTALIRYESRTHLQLWDAPCFFIFIRMITPTREGTRVGTVVSSLATIENSKMGSTPFTNEMMINQSNNVELFTLLCYTLDGPCETQLSPTNFRINPQKQQPFHNLFPLVL